MQCCSIAPSEPFVIDVSDISVALPFSGVKEKIV